MTLIVWKQTDGMSDNVFPAELISICSLVARQYAHAPPKRKRVPVKSDQAQVSPGFPCFTQLTCTRQPFEFVKDEEDALVQTMAERIVDYARLCMLNKKRVSPFERAAAREGMYFRGGVSTLYLSNNYDTDHEAITLSTETRRVSLSSLALRMI